MSQLWIPAAGREAAVVADFSTMYSMLSACPWAAVFSVCGCWRSELSSRFLARRRRRKEVCFGLGYSGQPCDVVHVRFVRSARLKAFLVVMETQNNPCDAATAED